MSNDNYECNNEMYTDIENLISFRVDNISSYSIAGGPQLVDRDHFM